MLQIVSARFAVKSYSSYRMETGTECTEEKDSLGMRRNLLHPDERPKPKFPWPMQPDPDDEDSP